MNLADEAVEAEFDRQMERLLDTLQPGRPKEVFGGMCDEWAAQIGRLDWVDPALFRAAVTAWLLTSDELPTLRQFVSLLREQASARRGQGAAATGVAPRRPSEQCGAPAPHCDRQTASQTRHLGQSSGARVQHARP
jgi:hypothetical protein